MSAEPPNLAPRVELAASPWQVNPAATRWLIGAPTVPAWVGALYVQKENR